MLKYIKNYRFRSIFLKNMCMAVVLLLLPFLITIALLKGAYNRVLVAEQDRYTEAISTQMVANVNGILSEMHSNMMMLQGSENVKLFSYANVNNQNDALYDFTNVRETLNLMSMTSDCIRDIYLYAEKSGDMIAKNGLVTARKQEILDWLPKGQSYGIYHGIGTNVNTSNIYIYYVLNEKKPYQMTIIYESDARSFAKRVRGEGDNPIELVFNDAEVWSDKKIAASEKSEYICVERDLDAEGMTLRIYFDKGVTADVLKSVVQLQRLAIAGLAVMILVTIWLVSIKMYAPVRTIMKTLENFESGAFLADEGNRLLENKNELEYILNAFYQENDKKQRAESELNERIIMMKKAQMVALQAQINPHFIFNTLDAINWRAIKHLGKRNEVSVMTGNLAKMIRLFGENANTLISLEEEIAHLTIYVKIMEMRCDNKFSLQWDIPEFLLQYKVVKLMLQPLVENAINHGALLLKEPSVISIRAYAKEEMLYISVKDRGPGIQERDLECLRNAIEQEVLREDRHFGLSNVNRRLRIMFGEKSGVKIESEWGCGTEVTITIPIANCVEES